MQDTTSPVTSVRLDPELMDMLIRAAKLTYNKPGKRGWFKQTLTNVLREYLQMKEAQREQPINPIQ